MGGMDFGKFVEEWSKEDELGVVVRSQIYVENELVNLLNHLIPSPEHLDKVRLGYNQRIHLALAMGLDPSFGPPLKALGKLRNDYAHQLGSHLTKDRTDAFYGTFDADFRQIISGSFARTREVAGPESVGDWNSLEPKDKFILYVIVLYHGLTTSIEKIIMRVQKDGGLYFRLEPTEGKDT